MSDSCGNVIDAAVETVAIGFELMESEVPRLPERVAAALQDPQVHAAITAALLAEAKRQLAEQAKATGPGSSQDGKDFALSLGKKTGNAIVQSVKGQIERSPLAKQIEEQLEQVKKDFKCSPVGVFINQHEGLLIVTGAVLAVGGAAAMYYTRTGDDIAKLAEGRELKFTFVSGLSLKAQVPAFIPSTRTFGTRITVSGDWKPVRVSLTASGTAQESTLRTGVSGEIIIPLAHGVTTVLSGEYNTGGIPLSRSSSPGAVEVDYKAALGLKVDAGQGLSFQLMGTCGPSGCTGSGSAHYSAKPAGVPLYLDVTGKAETSGVFDVGATLELEF